MTSSSYEDASSYSSDEETDSPVVQPRADSSGKVEASFPVTAANSSSEEEETDSESETEPVSKPKITTKSLSEVETDSRVVKPSADSSSKVEASASSEEEEEEESDSETEAETETEQEVETDSPAVKPSADSSSKAEAPVTTVDSSSEEEETDSESETDPVADSKMVGTSSKPETTAESLSEVEPDSSAVKSSEKPVTKKRYIEIDEGEAKRVKRVSGDDDRKIVGQEAKKNHFQRVWTEEDEITVLQGIIDYQNETGSSPLDDKNALYELLKNSISFSVTKTQFLKKIRGLKKKHDNNHGKEKKKGEAPAFSKPHDLEVFRLSKFVWGDDGIMANDIQVDPPVLKPAVEKQEFVSIVESMARFGVDKLFAKKGWVRLSSEDKKRIEEKWEALHLEELQFYSRKSGILHDAMTKMVEASQQDD